jgi:hypothetical protein
MNDETELSVRVLLLEDKADRNEKNIKELQAKCSETTVIVSTLQTLLPKIEKKLDTMDSKLDELNSYRVASESTTTGMDNWWKKYGPIVTNIIFMAGGVFVTMIYVSYMHAKGL